MLREKLESKLLNLQWEHNVISIAWELSDLPMLQVQVHIKTDWFSFLDGFKDHNLERGEYQAKLYFQEWVLSDISFTQYIYTPLISYQKVLDPLLILAYNHTYFIWITPPRLWWPIKYFTHCGCICGYFPTICFSMPLPARVLIISMPRNRPFLSGFGHPQVE